MKREEVLSQSDFSPVQIKGLLKIIEDIPYKQNGYSASVVQKETGNNQKEIAKINGSLTFFV